MSDSDPPLWYVVARSLLLAAYPVFVGGLICYQIDNGDYGLAAWVFVMVLFWTLQSRNASE